MPIVQVIFLRLPLHDLVNFCNNLTHVVNHESYTGMVGTSYLLFKSATCTFSELTFSCVVDFKLVHYRLFPLLPQGSF